MAGERLSHKKILIFFWNEPQPYLHLPALLIRTTKVGRHLGASYWR
jgi:hypothetical protein